MSMSIIDDLRQKCLELALSGNTSGAGLLSAFLPEIKVLSGTYPSMGRAYGLVRDVIAEKPGSLLALNRLLAAVSAAESEFVQERGLNELAAGPVTVSTSQVRYRSLVKMRDTLRGMDSASDRLLEGMSKKPELFDLRLLPELKAIAASDRIAAARLARKILDRNMRPEPQPSSELEAGLISRSQAFLAAYDMKGFAGELDSIGEGVPRTPGVFSHLCDLLKRLPGYRRYQSYERAVVCALVNYDSIEALNELEDKLEEIRHPRAVFSLALAHYSAPDFYQRYHDGLLDYVDKNYAEFRDALICHALQGNRHDGRWSDYFADRDDPLPALMTLSTRAARSAEYLKNFKFSAFSGGGPPSEEELLLCLALIPQTLLRMEIYDFWDCLWDYLEEKLKALISTGAGLPASLIGGQVLFTLSLNGDWIAEKLEALAADYPECSQLPDLISLIYEKSECFK